MPLPDFIKNKPDLQLGLEFYYRAFWDLAADRTGGMSEGLITYAAMSLWCRDHQVYDMDEVDRFAIVIRRMDVAYLDWKRKKNKTAPKSGGDTQVVRRNDAAMNMK